MGRLSLRRLPLIPYALGIGFVQASGELAAAVVERPLPPAVRLLLSVLYVVAVSCWLLGRSPPRRPT